MSAKLFPRCVHCGEVMPEPEHIYRVSRCHAHVRCVSQPSEYDMDQLLARSLSTFGHIPHESRYA